MPLSRLRRRVGRDAPPLERSAGAGGDATASAAPGRPTFARLLSRALRPAPTRRDEAIDQDVEPAADDATLAALRRELAEELARVSRERDRV